MEIMIGSTLLIAAGLVTINPVCLRICVGIDGKDIFQIIKKFHTFQHIFESGGFPPAFIIQNTLHIIT